jgi:hypothetical protein
MPNSDLLPSLLFKINENQLALEAAIMELTLWVEQRGAAEVADNVRSALDAIDRNEEFIKMTLAGDDDAGVIANRQKSAKIGRSFLAKLFTVQ